MDKIAQKYRYSRTTVVIQSPVWTGDQDKSRTLLMRRQLGTILLDNDHIAHSQSTSTDPLDISLHVQTIFIVNY